MLVQLNKCVVVCGSDLQSVCGSDLQRGHSGDGCLSSSILGFLFVLSWARVRRVALGSVVW